MRTRGTQMAERMIQTGGVELCTESIGNPADPPVLLIHGLGASMLWWEDGFCRRLAEGGRCVVRYDHRDTGRSSHDEPGRPRYTGADLTTDALGFSTASGSRPRTSWVSPRAAASPRSSHCACLIACCR